MELNLEKSMVLNIHCINVGIILNIRIVKSCISFIIHGMVKIITMTIPMILGIKLSVISLIWVVAWKILTARPKNIPTNNAGNDKINAILNVSIPKPNQFFLHHVSSSSMMCILVGYKNLVHPFFDQKSCAHIQFQKAC